MEGAGRERAHITRRGKAGFEPRTVGYGAVCLCSTRPFIGSPLGRAPGPAGLRGPRRRDGHRSRDHTDNRPGKPVSPAHAPRRGSRLTSGRLLALQPLGKLPHGTQFLKPGPVSEPHRAELPGCYRDWYYSLSHLKSSKPGHGRAASDLAQSPRGLGVEEPLALSQSQSPSEVTAAAGPGGPEPAPLKNEEGCQPTFFHLSDVCDFYRWCIRRDDDQKYGDGSGRGTAFAP